MTVVLRVVDNVTNDTVERKTFIDVSDLLDHLAIYCNLTPFHVEEVHSVAKGDRRIFTIDNSVYTYVIRRLP